MASSQSQWNKFINKKYILDTTKMYFDTYLYRAKFFVYGMNYSCYVKNRTEEQYVTWLKNQIKQTQWHMGNIYWHPKRGSNRDVSDYDSSLIYTVTKLINKRKSSSFKIRIEGNTLCVYTTTAAEMLQFFADAPQGLMDEIEEINRPASKAAIKKLNSKVIFQPNPTHKFKLMIRERKYTVEEMKAILSFVENHPDEEIKVTPMLKYRLSSLFDNHISGFIYSSDEKLTFMLQMIAPKLIKKVLVIEQL